MTHTTAQQDSSELVQLAKLLDLMTKTNRGEEYRFRPNKWMRRLQTCSMGMTVISAVALVIKVALHRLEERDLAITSSISEWWGVPVAVFGCLLIILTTISAIQALWKERHDSFSTIPKLIQGSMQDDAPYTRQLMTYPKALLEYALLHYRHHWGVVDGRTLLIAGDIRKLGLFPGLLAISVAAPKLLIVGSNAWLWAPIILAGCFHLMAFFVMASGERRNQVIALIQYAIDHCSDKAATDAALNIHSSFTSAEQTKVHPMQQSIPS